MEWKMREPDFSGIDPLRVPEVRRRIAALDTYLALPSPSTVDALRLGQSVGLSRWQFQRLVRVWRDHRSPKLLVAGRRGASKRDYGIAPRAIEIARETIAHAEPDEPVTVISSMIEDRCAEEGVAPPSRPTIWNYVRAARQVTPASGPPRIVIGRMWFHLPMRDRAVEAMPMLLAATLLPEGIIITHRISTDPMMPPSVADLIAEVATLRVPDAPVRALVMDDDDRRAASAVITDAGLGRARGRPQSAQRDLSRSMAGKLGPLEALYRRSRARPATRKAAARFEEPLDPADVSAAIERAVAISNASRVTTVPAFDIAAD